MARRVSVAILVGLTACAMSGCGGLPVRSQMDEPIGDATIAVIDRGWHTDISVPAERISGPAAMLVRAFPGARFLVFGFGDRAYYMSPEQLLGQMAAAVFPDPGVMLLTALSAPPADAFGADRVVTLHVSQAEIDRIVAFIWQTLDRRTNGLPRRLADGPYPGSAFYASGETYDALDNCNTWTALALYNGGLPIDPSGVIFASQVMARVREVLERQNELERGAKLAGSAAR
jgi:hypothetical protein